METHVKVLGTLNIVLGVLGMFGALAMVLVFGAAAAGVSGDADAAVALPIIGLTGTAVVATAATVSLAGMIVGYGLYHFKPWARIAGIVLSIVSLMMLPFGTILGVYGLWVLFSKDGERLFAAAVTHA